MSRRLRFGKQQQLFGVVRQRKPTKRFIRTRNEIARRMRGGETAADIAAEMNLSVASVWDYVSAAKEVGLL